MKENQHVEWKENWRDEYLKWICGFANADGGLLVIGRNDRGVTVGVSNARKLLEDLPNKVRDVLGIMVDVRVVEENGKELIEIRVESYPSPVSYKGEYHYRSGSTKQELKGAALEQFLLKKRGRHWDGVLEPSFTARSCSTEAIRLFKEKAMKSGRMGRAVLHDSTEVILENLELVEKHGLKRAACLLFSDRPEQFVSGSWIKIGFFVTDDDLQYQDEVHGNLFDQVEKTLELLHTKYLKAYISYQGLQRVETFLFPYAALREALLNAVVHKDYSSGIPIQISVYNNKIVLWNPGNLPENWTMERLLGKHPSRPFNPLLANAFFRVGYIEAWGRGIEKINRECREHDIQPPEYDFGMAGLMLTFQANPAHMRADILDQGSTTPIATPITTPITTQDKLVSLILAKPEISQQELAEALGLTRGGIKYHLNKMKLDGVLRHVGPARGGSWEVLK
ncbi:putative transcriptional regulator with HTH domain [Methanomethylovorans hollandica DSM 15978]|uniref:Putative transcriptional regulator with HTH domain n=1 Tax=Methanomethylovorans hollandica (strain DSM 15978 / NBRC 107637 / DMS1) TaxID=867904 RepID=L0KZQ7_METHD|nr:ATP-binding protein [Methanomethylovorans hollandica]AGB49583.1 putative transcriptional regulator with HTH domain [Methanomethylovorans hollandica DSM 15978]